MKASVVAIASLLLTHFCAFSNTDDRTWTYKDGSKVFAHITDWDNKSDIVTFVDDHGKTITAKRDDLSLVDQAFVRRWFMIHDKMETKLAELGGTMTHLQFSHTYTTDYYVYKPSTYKADGSAPMMILFSPSGNGYGMMLRHFEAAEKAGFLLVTLDVFKNRDDQDESLARFLELLPILEQTPHDPKKLFMGGTSGGAWRSYDYSGQVDRPWAGIYAAGGWLGYTFDEDYLDDHVHHGMKVAMVTGDRDHAAARFVPRDSNYLTKTANCDVAMFAFEGGHQVPSYDSQVEAFEWLLFDD
jgi:predicted esterase